MWKLKKGGIFKKYSLLHWFTKVLSKTPTNCNYTKLKSTLKSIFEGMSWIFLLFKPKPIRISLRSNDWTNHLHPWVCSWWAWWSRGCRARRRAWPDLLPRSTSRPTLPDPTGRRSRQSESKQSPDFPKAAEVLILVDFAKTSFTTQLTSLDKSSESKAYDEWQIMNLHCGLCELKQKMMLVS